MAACMAVVDEDGKFEQPWLRWFNVQRKLARRHEELEKQAGKLFTLHDVDMTKTYLEDSASDLESGRLQPSAAEFMAAITVEVATNMDLNAEARAGRQPGRPDAAEFEPSTLGRDAEDPEAEARIPAGDDGPEFEQADGGDGRLDQELGKLKQPLHAFPQADYRGIAFHEGIGTNACMSKYAAAFAEHMGRHLRHDVRLGYESPAEVTAERTAYTALRPKKNLDESVRLMEEMFNYKTQTLKPEADELCNGPGRTRSKQVGEPEAARFVDGVNVSPALFARALMNDLANRDQNPVKLNAEQEDFLAVVAAKMQEVVDVERGSQHTGSGDQAAGPSGCVEPCCVLLCGPGGSGKTEVVSIIRQMMSHFFGEGSDVAMASSNSAARVIGGDTVHSCLHLNGKASMKLESLGRGVTPELCARWCDVKCLILEEISMMSPMMLAAISYRLCLARCGRHVGITPALYTDRAHCFGGIPIVVMLGDFMQLAPLGEEGGRMSLLMEPRAKCAAETRAGLHLFRQALTHVMFLRTTHRFVDRSVEPHKACPVLPRLLAYMRSPAGEPMPEDLWQAVQSWVVKGPRDIRLQCPRQQKGFQMAIAWEAVARLMQYRAASGAAKAGEMLIYVQAVDVAKTCQLTRDEYRRALQVVNMTKTGKLLGMCPLFVGMRVRLNVKLSSKYKIMHDATGAVVGFEFDPREDVAWMNQDTHLARRAGHVTLKYLPKAVYVRFDDFEGDFGNGTGVVPIRPTKGSWVYNAHRNRVGRRDVVKVDMKRVQIPLAPEQVRTVQTSQGLSMDAATMLLTKPSYMTEDDWWMHLYVMVSRVRTSAQMLVYDLPPREMFERGPPDWVHTGIRQLEELAVECDAAVEDVRRRLQWPRVSQPARLAKPEEQLNESASTDTGAVSVVFGQEIHMKDVESVMELGVDVDSGDVCDTVGAALLPLPRPPATAAEDGRDRKLDDSVPSHYSVAWFLTEQRQRFAPELVPGDNEPDNDARRKAFAQCEYEALTSAKSRVGDQASEEAPRGLSILHQFPAERAEMLYGRVPCEVGGDCQRLVAASRGVGLANPSVNACFVNASLQCFVRLEAVAALLAKHLDAHGVDDASCVACALGRLASALRTGSMTTHSAAALLDHVRQGKFAPNMRKRVFRSVTTYPQCDAAELLFVIGHLGLTQVCNAWEDQLVGENFCDESGAPRYVMPDFVCGVVIRHRVFCSVCSAASDKLERAEYLDLNVVGDNSATLRGMLDKYLSEYSSVDTKCPKECGGLGSDQVLCQRFVEKEPAVLFVRLARGRHDGTKNNAPVEFPEVLTCMRSGPYHFASVVRHKGRSCECGHYVATCWRGEHEYTLYDDWKVTDVTWLHVATKEAQRQAYVLVYVRAGFWQGVACDGTEETPYARDEASKEAVAIAKRMASDCPAVVPNMPAPCAPAVSVQQDTGSQELMATENGCNPGGDTGARRAGAAGFQRQRQKRARELLPDAGPPAVPSDDRKEASARDAFSQASGAEASEGPAPEAPSSPAPHGTASQQPMAKKTRGASGRDIVARHVDAAEPLGQKQKRARELDPTSADVVQPRRSARIRARAEHGQC